jgi:cbb3-type cytochrome oxidase subunit 1
VMAAMKPYYALRFIAGLLFLSGALLMTYNLARTFAGHRTVEVAPPAGHRAGAPA